MKGKHTRHPLFLFCPSALFCFCFVFFVLFFATHPPQNEKKEADERDRTKKGADQNQMGNGATKIGMVERLKEVEEQQKKRGRYTQWDAERRQKIFMNCEAKQNRELLCADEMLVGIPCRVVRIKTKRAERQKEANETENEEEAEEEETADQGGKKRIERRLFGGDTKMTALLYRMETHGEDTDENMPLIYFYAKRAEAHRYASRLFVLLRKQLDLPKLIADMIIVYVLLLDAFKSDELKSNRCVAYDTRLFLLYERGPVQLREICDRHSFDVRVPLVLNDIDGSLAFLRNHSWTDDMLIEYQSADRGDSNEEHMLNAEREWADANAEREKRIQLAIATSHSRYSPIHTDLPSVFLHYKGLTVALILVAESSNAYMLERIEWRRGPGSEFF